ncbi:N-acetylmuramoyl-L-alanine amidase [Oceanobacillus halophilus]|uniref:N-acetylmuramoyl-L-alanine amidase n=2 Tax=Oceanobacillus halophilus TaxID=930130 RepID=A0A495A5I5_9BACI|nr:N-acetylmuramoyl-L-alanine amidase [Oceanobacillus halophilus]
MVLFLIVAFLAFSTEKLVSSQASNQDKGQVVDKPVVPKIETKEASLPNENSKPRTEPITHLVLHFSSNVIVNPEDPFRMEDIRQTFMDYGVSAHYLIGRDGAIYSLVPEERVAYHAGKGELSDFPQYKNRLNDYSIGIEIMAIGTKEEMSIMMDESKYEEIDSDHIGYTDAQYDALVKLIDNVIERHPSIKKDRKHIIGHDEYAPGRKTDPGELFDWSRIGYEEKVEDSTY